MMLCDKCELGLKQSDWFRQISARNAELIERLIDCEETITMLKLKLIDKAGAQLESNGSCMENTLLSKDVIIGQKAKPYQTESYKNYFLQILDERERQLMKNVTYFREMASFYRECCLDEMRLNTELSSSLKDNASRIQEEMRIANRNYLEAEQKATEEEISSRYKNAIKHANRELSLKENLMEKLRGDRRELYMKLASIKKERESEKKNYESKIRSLTDYINLLKRK